MRNSLFLLAAIFALTCLVCGQNGKPSFSITIKARQSGLKAGVPAIIEIAVTNVTDHLISYEGEHGSIDWGAFDFGFDVTDSAGGRVPETDYFKATQGEHGVSITREGIGTILYAAPSDGGEAGLPLSPGGSLTTHTDLTKLFKLTPGTYTIQLWRSREGIRFVGGKPEPLTNGHTYEDNTKPVVRSNKITITVTP